MSEILQSLIDRWASHKLKCPLGVTTADVAEFESKYSVRMPSDLRHYFLQIDGMGGEGIVDNDFFSFWQLRNVRRVSEERAKLAMEYPEAAHYFLFADHSILLPAFAIRLSDDSRATPVALVWFEPGSIIIQDAFHSFSNFVACYLRDPVGATIAPSLEV